MSTLPNGLRIVTDPTPGHFAALGVYIDAGLRFETPQTLGLLHLLDRIAWKSTNTRTGVQMMDQLARLGGNYMAGALRELVMYQASVFNRDVPQMFDCMADTVRSPRLTEDEVAEAKQSVAYELDELVHNHSAWLTELLHATAYGQNALGLPLFGTAEALEHTDRAAVAAFHAAHYAPKNAVVAMVGVEHSAAEAMAASALGDWTAASINKATDIESSGNSDKTESSDNNGNAEGTATTKATTSPRYVGGEVCVPFRPPRFSNLPRLVHMQVAFETRGLRGPDLYALATLQKLLGGGLSFLAGGPGKGMFLRLFRVLNHHPFVENCLCFHHAYSDLGLFGITISCYEGYEQHMAQVVAHELAKVADEDVGAGAIAKHELRRAKNQLVAALLMNAESKLASLEDMGRQVQCVGSVVPVAEMEAHISLLTVEDVRDAARAVLLALQPTVVMQGSRKEFGDVDFVMRHFGLGAGAADAAPQPDPLRYTSRDLNASSWFY